MQPILQAAWDALLLTVTWPNILYPVTATLLAMGFSLVPGLSGVTLLALVIPFVITLETIPTMLIFGALLGGATFMGSVTAILLNIPGRSSNAATTVDGYPMSQQGQARTAIGCSATASAFGSTFGILVLIGFIPIMREAILLFGPLETVLAVVWGLTTIAAVNKGSLTRGLIVAGLGLLASFIGVDPLTAEPRYTLGTTYLRDGLDLVPVLLGIFAVSEMIDLASSKRQTISGNTRFEELTGSTLEGMLAVFKHFGLFLRSSILGTLVGLIPGIGGTVAGFVAYGHAVESARDKSRFGNGDVRGVLAPEAANDAKDGGALVPTLALGIPGGAATAMLLVVMAFHGLAPGRELMETQLTLVFVLIWSLFISNWLSSIMGLMIVNPLARLTVLPTHLLIPGVLSVVAMGAMVYRGHVGDILITFLMGGIGYYLKKFGWPRIPFIIALILGPQLERHLLITIQLRSLNRLDIWSKPMVLLLLALTLTTFGLSARRHFAR